MTHDTQITLNRLTWAALVLSALSVVMVAILAVTVFSIRSTAVVDVFGDFPEQIILGEHEHEDGETDLAVIPVGEALEVEGTKCYRADATVVGRISWQMVEPIIVVVPVEGLFRGEVLKGCVTRTFNNIWPETAILVTNEILGSNPEVRVVWRIEGIETPIDGGLSQTWQTEPFVAVLQEGE